MGTVGRTGRGAAAHQHHTLREGRVWVRPRLPSPPHDRRRPEAAQVGAQSAPGRARKQRCCAAACHEAGRCVCAQSLCTASTCLPLLGSARSPEYCPSPEETSAPLRRRAGGEKVREGAQRLSQAATGEPRTGGRRGLCARCLWYSSSVIFPPACAPCAWPAGFAPCAPPAAAPCARPAGPAAAPCCALCSCSWWLMSHSCAFSPSPPDSVTARVASARSVPMFCERRRRKVVNGDAGGMRRSERRAQQGSPVRTGRQPPPGVGGEITHNELVDDLLRGLVDEIDCLAARRRRGGRWGCGGLLPRGARGAPPDGLGAGLRGGLGALPAGGRGGGGGCCGERGRGRGGEGGGGARGGGSTSDGRGAS